eukprot:TRINITY_DN8514_c0_g1_i1.p1 TRINITY_DN8514_c0_g1~~TRINITY_DN8514_c0_g1_i1.p1  ORF type:complete len:269 (-),score=31.50 TRINITY_DN8514_c0_g1_i1:155-934(-)
MCEAPRKIGEQKCNFCKLCLIMWRCQKLQSTNNMQFCFGATQNYNKKQLLVQNVKCFKKNINFQFPKCSKDSRNPSLNPNIERRNFILFGITILSSQTRNLNSQSFAEEKVEDLDIQDLLDQELKESILLNSNVVPAKKVREYLSIIQTQQEKTWNLIEQQIEDEDYANLSNNLVISPFDDLKQAAFYIPFQMINEDVELSLAVKSREAYTNFDKSFNQFVRIVNLASIYQAEQDEVQQQYLQLRQAFYEFLRLVVQTV